MRLPRSSVLVLCAVLGLSGCKFGDDVKHVAQDAQAASRELTKTYGVLAHVNVAAEDLESPRQVTVKLQAAPAGLSREQVERNANIVVRKYLPRVERVEVVMPPARR